jgi:uncharacterized protein YbjT (DUF2867 family)
MKVLLTGATGFIGGRLRDALLDRGHDVVCAGRRPPSRGRWVRIDYAQATTPKVWLPHVEHVDAVVNAVGIFKETKSQRFALVHTRAPCALFEACRLQGVTRVVQVSALGAERAQTQFQSSKHAADEFLLRLPLDGVVAQPSLVFGIAGTSSMRFIKLSVLPWIALPGRGEQPVQPVHVDDVVEALCALVERPSGRQAGGARIALAGPRPYTFCQYLQALRASMQLAPNRISRLPDGIAELLARMGDLSATALFDRAALKMLEQGNVAEPTAIARLLGRMPRDVPEFLDARTASLVRRDAEMDWLLVLARLSLAIVWIATGVVSLVVFPHADSYALLARVGVGTALQPLLLFGAAGFDLALGILTLAPPAQAVRRRVLWLAQIALMLFYMIVIAWKLPEFWSHPFGPLLKNFPMLALLALLWQRDRD